MSFLEHRFSLRLENRSSRERLPDHGHGPAVQILSEDQIPLGGGYQLDHMNGRKAKDDSAV